MLIVIQSTQQSESLKRNFVQSQKQPRSNERHTKIDNKPSGRFMARVFPGSENARELLFYRVFVRSSNISV